MELVQLDHIELFADTVTSRTVYLNVLFPSKYRYYLEFVNSPEIPILIDHFFRLYFPQTIAVKWADPDGVYLILGVDPEFYPWGPLVVQIYIPQVIYDAIIAAMQNPINSPADLVPPPEGNACGEVEFVLLSTDAGEQIKIDLVNTSYTPEIPITVKTLQWNEVLYYVMRLAPPTLLPPSLPPPSSTFSSWDAAGDSSVSLAENSSDIEFAYTVSGVLGITFIDPRYCFLREWIAFPPDWTQAIKNFAGIQ